MENTLFWNRFTSNLTLKHKQNHFKST